jgi:uncharacterized membrane protein (UPF0127 family)
LRTRRLIVERSGAVVAARIEVAETFWTRLVGLLGRAWLDPDAGLLIEPCNSVHTFFMRFPIDVAFLDRDGVVVRAIANLKPWRATKLYTRAHSTLELAAGTLERAGVVDGDRLIDGALKAL